MPGTTRVTVSLPDHIFHAVEKARKHSGEPRSVIYRRALELMLSTEEEDALSTQYTEGYKRCPETSNEIEAAQLTAHTILNEEPW